MCASTSGLYSDWSFWALCSKGRHELTAAKVVSSPGHPQDQLGKLHVLAMLTSCVCHAWLQYKREGPASGLAMLLWPQNAVIEQRLAKSVLDADAALTNLLT